MLIEVGYCHKKINLFNAAILVFHKGRDISQKKHKKLYIGGKFLRVVNRKMGF